MIRFPTLTLPSTCRIEICSLRNVEKNQRHGAGHTPNKITTATFPPRRLFARRYTVGTCHFRFRPTAGGMSHSQEVSCTTTTANKVPLKEYILRVVRVEGLASFIIQEAYVRCRNHAERLASSIRLQRRILVIVGNSISASSSFTSIKFIAAVHLFIRALSEQDRIGMHSNV